jgi:ATP-dependent RNA helicase DeaD
MTQPNDGIQWNDIQLPDNILTGIQDCNYTSPTDVQAKAIPVALEGKDIIVRSKTGTGKTAAFMLPILARVPEGYGKPAALILCPSRELAKQVAQETRRLCVHKNLKISVIYGGVSIQNQTRELKDGAEIIIGTPGRIQDHMRRGNLNLSEVITSTLDEADEMLSMGFQKDVTWILSKLPKTVQILLFSATIEERLKQIIGKYLKDPVDLYLSLDTDQGSENVHHILYNARPDYSKPRQLIYIIEQIKPHKSIIFCNTKSDTTMVARFLERQYYTAQDISSDLSQHKREQVMQKIKESKIDFLIATDIAARGIDIPELSHVFNYSLPEDPAVYLHRTGRTGRIGNKGVAISMMGPRERNCYMHLKQKYDVEFEERKMPEKEQTEQAMIDRQLSLLRKSPALAFEGFLPLARQLKDLEKSDALIAKALYGFFQWDRKITKPGSDDDNSSDRHSDNSRGNQSRNRRNRKRRNNNPR